jgi:hypothetical protein
VFVRLPTHRPSTRQLLRQVRQSQPMLRKHPHSWQCSNLFIVWSVCTAFRGMCSRERTRHPHSS